MPAEWGPTLWTVAGFTLAGVVLQLSIKRWGSRLTRLTAGRFDDLLVAAITPHLALWCLLAGVVSATAAAPLGPEPLHLLREGAAALFILSVTFALAGLGTSIVSLYGGNLPLGSSEASLPHTLVRTLILVLGFVTILSQLGISMGPVLTALGVGSLAVALALQDTFANFFAGFYVMMSKQISVGDFVKLDSGQEGHINDISWRVCRLQELNGNYIIVPNQKLAQAIVYNYDKPQKELSLVVSLGVSYRNDLDQVEKVTCEVAKKVLQATPGAVAEFEPFIRYNEFGDAAVRFSVILKIRQFVDRYLLTHEFMKALHARYGQEKIEMVVPWQDVRLNLSPAPVPLKEKAPDPPADRS